MKSVSTNYTAGEEATTRQPVELYHIYRGETHWRYTSGDVAVVHAGQTWQPATISRGQVEYHGDLEISKLAVTFAKTNPAVSAYLANIPVQLAWIEVIKLFRDHDPADPLVLFIGQILKVSLKGSAIQASCEGLEAFLKQQIPKYCYQPECNWSLFDDKCTLDRESWAVTANSVTVEEDGITIISADFLGYSADHYTLGYLEWGEWSRLITNSTESMIKIAYAIPGLTSGQSVTVYAGCNGLLSTCRDKFDNVVNFGGHPYIPLDNPATWITK